MLSKVLRHFRGIVVPILEGSLLSQHRSRPAHNARLVLHGVVGGTTRAALVDVAFHGCFAVGCLKNLGKRSLSLGRPLLSTNDDGRTIRIEVLETCAGQDTARFIECLLDSLFAREHGCPWLDGYTNSNRSVGVPDGGCCRHMGTMIIISISTSFIYRKLTAHPFGEGIVKTPSDFGTRSDPPTHPLLLDFLAQKFVESGWSVKNLHRMILLSATFRQA
ncbi:MAG: DUF1553 domain-containing protein, partial [Rhodobacteraceae bacterium]|nr:DUF1553 domain-containing protein [Paracoccaceae bacterium]